jgi:hypothetical protein
MSIEPCVGSGCAVSAPRVISASECRAVQSRDRRVSKVALRVTRFIHALPSVDPNMLTNAMSRIELSHDGTSRPRTRTDEFPDLHLASNQRGAVFDPSRNRFANAVKRPVQGPGPQYTHIIDRSPLALASDVVWMDPCRQVHPCLTLRLVSSFAPLL